VQTLGPTKAGQYWQAIDSIVSTLWIPQHSTDTRSRPRRLDFRQALTGWVNPNAMVGFDASVKAIIKHRQANPAIAAKHALSTDPTDVGNELEKYTRLRLGIPLVQPTFSDRAATAPVRRGCCGH